MGEAKSYVLNMLEMGDLQEFLRDFCVSLLSCHSGSSTKLVIDCVKWWAFLAEGRGPLGMTISKALSHEITSKLFKPNAISQVILPLRC